MTKMDRLPVMIFFLSFILGCNPIKGVQEAREKANQGMKMILENIDGYVQKAEIAAQKAERACFCFIRKNFQKSGSSRPENGMGAPKGQIDKGSDEKDFDCSIGKSPFPSNFVAPKRKGEKSVPPGAG